MSEYLENTNEEPKPVSEMKDEEILRASQKEPAMFQILVDKYQQPLTRAAFRVVRSKEESEDIVQESFVKIYKNADKFQKYEGIEFKSWAYKIVVNTAITHYRKLKKGEYLMEDPALFESPEGDTPEEKAMEIDIKKEVSAVLKEMPDHLSKVLKMYYLDDKSYNMIAEEESISIPTLKMRLFRAKKVFRKLTNKNI